ncbi:receptor-like protein 7 [Tripterygium wilfordii]|uniref:receptor-like protein 7 n=1 Tax=Tripterygium wilfordii TaxID=458696 RepID=UPI0018F7E666|nr:receptor-like protein 7 [Tripterygium wilfordii]
MTPLLCHNEESLALLQFKRSFVVNKSASSDASAYPKTISWNQQGENPDCCLWDGVVCDQYTGRVISLDLSSSCLYGSINSSSSLFHLRYLQSLNLADNHFNSSQIPSGFGSFQRLVDLNLSSSKFYGKIPLEIAGLSRLRSLDLTGDWDESNARMLELTSTDLTWLVQNLTHIEKLHLDNVDLSATIPEKVANLSSLSSLSLHYCRLLGIFPMGIFELPNLQFLNVGMNEELAGHLPEFHWGSPLKSLMLQYTKFSGGLPPSIGNLHSLTTLNIAQCKFWGQIPSSLGNLSNITVLILGENNFFGQIPSSFANLTQLTTFSILGNDNFSCGPLSWLEKQTEFTKLGLENCNISGEIPHFLKNFTRLNVLQLTSNRLRGQIPHWLTNLTRLVALDLGSNEFHGPFPRQISELANLEDIYLGRNHLSGNVNLNPFFNLQHMTTFHISDNDITLLHVTNANATLRKWHLLGLSSCNLREFPDFLRYQDKLRVLELIGNKIHGQIPSWLWNINRETLEVMALRFNFLTGFEQPALVSRLGNIRYLMLDGNKIQGPVPRPPPSIVQYSLSDNSLSGEISSTFCHLPNLYVLDLSFNNLSGMLPQCFFDKMNSLNILNLEQNFFRGTIPETLTNGSMLRMINLGHNALQGKLPRSLANHTMLEVLHVGDNQISDTFPFWLGALHNLQVLILRSNKLFGAVGSPATGFEFSKLRIIDISHNGFTGILPSKYFQKWNGMRNFDVDHFSYMTQNTTLSSFGFWVQQIYSYQLTLVNKGVSMDYKKLPQVFVAIDLSSNKFEGEIPESIATLKNLLLLNLSNNHLSGHIPSAIENLTVLESLDFSSNMLSGKIPHELSHLTFLSFLNVSCNQLIGPIPQGKQFATFENNSYKDNLGLCGFPLSKLCGNAGELPPSPPTDEDDEGSGGSSAYILWMIVAIGYASGVVVGVVAGLIFTAWKHEWFVETFGRRQQKRRRLKTRRGQRKFGFNKNKLFLKKFARLQLRACITGRSRPGGLDIPAQPVRAIKVGPSTAC